MPQLFRPSWPFKDIMIIRSLGHGAHGQALEMVWPDWKRGARKLIKAKMSGYGTLRARLHPQREQTAFKELNFLRAVTLAKPTNLITLLVCLPSHTHCITRNHICKIHRHHHTPTPYYIIYFTEAGTDDAYLRGGVAYVLH